MHECFLEQAKIRIKQRQNRTESQDVAKYRLNNRKTPEAHLWLKLLLSQVRNARGFSGYTLCKLKFPQQTENNKMFSTAKNGALFVIGHIAEYADFFAQVHRPIIALGRDEKPQKISHSDSMLHF